MDEEPSLPRLVPDSQNESLTLNSRKRVRLSSPVFSPSSDPPLFSSDDDPSADNYTSARRKKIYRGPWYHHELVSEGEKKPKRTLQRQVDSGVWMGSDGTDFEESDLEQLPRKTYFEDKGLPKRKLPETSPEELAEKHIESCLDNGIESISLIACGLKTLTRKAIILLSTFTCIPASQGEPFQTLEPKLKLLLSSNSFERIPREMFNLQHLQVLSFRANEIKEISPAISQLRQLVELNIANNCLRFLPFEILELFKGNTQLREFHIHPNPFYEPDVSGRTYREKIGHRISPNALSNDSMFNYWRTTHRYSSPVSFFSIRGSLVKGPMISAHGGSLPQQILVVETEIIQTPPSDVVSAAPSLLEVAVRTCYQSTQLPRLASFLHPETPDYLFDLLTKAQTLKEDGGQKCTICEKEFIIARTEWVEWWEIAKTGRQNGSTAGTASAASPLRHWEEKSGRDQIEAMVPLIRRGCSWKCFQQALT